MVGTTHGLGFFRLWARAIAEPVAVPAPGKRDKKDRLHLSDFPGLEEAYGIKSDPDALVAYTVDPDKIAAAVAIENHHEAVAARVELFLALIERHTRDEERSVDVDVWVIVVPEIVFESCRPEAGKRRKFELVKGEHAKKQKGRVDLPLLAEVVLKPTPVTRLKPPLAPPADSLVTKTGATNGFGAYTAFIPGRDRVSADGEPQSSDRPPAHPR